MQKIRAAGFLLGTGFVAGLLAACETIPQQGLTPTASTQGGPMPLVSGAASSSSPGPAAPSPTNSPNPFGMPDDPDDDIDFDDLFGDDDDDGAGGTNPSPVGPNPVAPAGNGGGPNPVTSAGSGGGPNPVNPNPDPATQMCEPEPAYQDPTAPGVTFPYDTISSTVDAKFGSLSLADKVAQMGGNVCTDSAWCVSSRSENFSTPEVAGIRGFKFRDGPRGLSELEEQNNPNRKATAFPVSVARGASFDLDLEYRIGAAICTEALASGWNNVLAPTVNLTKHPAVGRAQESYGEDPFLAGKMGVAFVSGCQQYAQACIKHYVGNEIESGREVISANFPGDMGMRTLRENYVRPFEMAVEDADVACVMASFNEVNDVHVTEHAFLLKDLLRGEFGFHGFTLSDWDALVSSAPSANAGMDVEMPTRYRYSQLESLVNNGEVAAANVDASVRAILTQKYRFGWADAMQGYQDTAQVTGAGERFDNTSYLEHPDHIALAREAAVKGTVLLKNDNDRLPITADKYTTVAIVAPAIPPQETKGNISFWEDWELAAGNWAAAARLGDKGSSQVLPSYRVSPLQGMQNQAPAGINVITNAAPFDLQSAADAVAQADIVIVVGALTSYDEGEEWQNGADREFLELPDNQGQFIADVAAMGKPTVALLEGGGPLTMENWGDSVDGIVMAWYPGMEGGNAIADLLYGKENFSGRLPQTWPVSMDDVGPLASNQDSDFEYYHGYRMFDRDDKEPLFPFGFGLSYSEFVYGDVTFPCATASKDSVIRVEVQIGNAGPMPGTEVIQVYIGFPAGGPERPLKEFKVARRVDLGVEEAKEVTIALPVKDWGYFDTDTNDWVVQPGVHTLYVGRSSRDIIATGEVTVE